MKKELEEAKTELEMARVHLVQLRGGGGGGLTQSQLFKTVILLGFCHNMRGVPQSQPKKSQKITKKSPITKKMGLFYDKILCLE